MGQSKKSVPKVDPRSYGDPAEIRTPDTLLKRQVLCRLSYWVIFYSNMQRHEKSWQGWLDSNQRVRESKSLALPLGYTPVYSSEKRVRAGAEAPALPPCVGWVKGLEPSTPGTTIRCSNQLSYTHHIATA